jgi:pimeloyl-ACP methyl ester carboxylesterase
MKTKLAFKSQEGKTTVVKFYDALLEHWPIPNEKLYVNTRYGSTFVIATGGKNAPPLTLLHGSAMNSIMWMEDVVYKALSIEKASLIGISLGAWLSIKFSVSYPEKVDKLVLLCPAGIGPQKISFLINATV